MDNFTEMAPIIYTPTVSRMVVTMILMLVCLQVGWACSHFSHIYRRSRGMYFCRHDRHEMASMVYNWESDEVQQHRHGHLSHCVTPVSRWTRWW